MATLHRNTAATGAVEGNGKGRKGLGGGSDCMRYRFRTVHGYTEVRGRRELGKGRVCRVCERLIEVEGYGSSAAGAGRKKYLLQLKVHFG